MSIEYPCVYWIGGMCKKFSDDESTSWCVEGPCGDQMPSNADRIRSMSDEELAKILGNKCLCPPTSECVNCVACWLEWLQKPAEPPKEE